MSIVVILGMHRSGSSFLAHALHEAGLYMGDDLMNEPEGSNPDGHWEARPSVIINDHLLSLAGGAWDRPPAALTIDEATPARMDDFLRGLESSPIAGWKDPRTTITFPLWKPHLHEQRIIACLRNPVSVARSLQVREGWSLEHGMELWKTYNERLLENLREEAEVLWFNFDTPADEMAAAIRRLCETVGLSWHAGLSNLFNPFFRHHESPEAAPPGPIADLYAHLLTRAARSGRDTAPGAAAASGARGPAEQTVGPAPVLPAGDASPLEANGEGPLTPANILQTAITMLRLLPPSAAADNPRSFPEQAADVSALRATCDELLRRMDALAKAHRQQNEAHQLLARQVRPMVDAVRKLGSSPSLDLGVALAEVIELREHYRACLGLAPQVAQLMERQLGTEQTLDQLNPAAVAQQLVYLRTQVDRAFSDIQILVACNETANQKQMAVDEGIRQLQEAATMHGQLLHQQQAAIDRLQEAAGLHGQLIHAHHAAGERARADIDRLATKVAAVASEQTRLAETLAGACATLANVANRQDKLLRDVEELRAQNASRAESDEYTRQRLGHVTAEVGMLAIRSHTSEKQQARLRQGLSQCAANTAALKERERELTRLVEECQRFVNRVRDSQPFRVRRALANRTKKLAADLRGLVVRRDAVPDNGN